MLVYSFELLLYNFVGVVIQFFDVVVVVQLLRCFPISLCCHIVVTVLLYSLMLLLYSVGVVALQFRVLFLTLGYCTVLT